MPTSRSYWFSPSGEAPLFRPISVRSAVKDTRPLPAVGLCVLLTLTGVLTVRRRPYTRRDAVHVSESERVQELPFLKLLARIWVPLVVVLVIGLEDTLCGSSMASSVREGSAKC